MSDKTATATIPNVPASWPGAFGAYKHSKQVVQTNLRTLVIIWLITLLIGGAADNILKTSGNMIGFLVGSLTSAAFTLTFIAAVRGKRLEVGEAFNQAFPFWLKAIGLNILVAISLAISFLLLIVPFFIVLPRLVLVTYFLVDKKLGVVDAYKASWNATRDNSGKIWGIIGVHFLIVLLMVTIIGIPFAIYFLIMYSGVFGVLYEFLNKPKHARTSKHKPKRATARAKRSA